MNKRTMLVACLWLLSCLVSQAQLTPQILKVYGKLETKMGEPIHNVFIRLDGNLNELPKFFNNVDSTYFFNVIAPYDYEIYVTKNDDYRNGDNI